MSFNRSKSKSSGTKPGQYGKYFDLLNAYSGGDLRQFARNGTQQASQLSTEQIQAYGGLGATRRADAERLRARAIEELTADPDLSVAQKTRARQLTDEETASRLDAIGKETEAAMTDAARFNSDIERHNNELRREDMEALARIFYAGKAQNSTSSGTGGSFWG